MMSIPKGGFLEVSMQLLPKAQAADFEVLRFKVNRLVHLELQRAAEEAGITIEEAADQLIVQALKLLRLQKRRENRKGQAQTKPREKESGE